MNSSYLTTWTNDGRSNVLITFESQIAVHLSSKQLRISKSNKLIPVRPMCLILLQHPKLWVRSGRQAGNAASLTPVILKLRHESLIVEAIQFLIWEAKLLPVLILKLFRNGLLECSILFIFRNESSHLLLTVIVYKEMWSQLSCWPCPLWYIWWFTIQQLSLARGDLNANLYPLQPCVTQMNV